MTAVSASLARVEREDAARFAALVGAEHRWEETAELENPAYLRNDLDRCYHCKTELFRLSHDLAARLGYGAIAYGYNASDRGDFRPGHRAAKENDIIAPLDEAGLAKDEIRELMRAAGLPLADKPASPCLSSRLMTGVAVTSAKLRDVEDLEALLRGAGQRLGQRAVVAQEEVERQLLLAGEVAVDRAFGDRLPHLGHENRSGHPDAPDPRGESPRRERRAPPRRTPDTARPTASANPVRIQRATARRQ